MNGEERRKIIIDMLTQDGTSINANKLAEKFSVTRQIVVADIALLRASGYRILSDRRGYTLAESNSGITKRIAVKHGKDDVSDEFYAVVDNGGKVLDVIVEHSVYGKISAELDISSRYDADCFVKRIEETGANPLSALTEGIHIHTLLVKDEAMFERIVDRLTELGILIESA